MYVHVRTCKYVFKQAHKASRQAGRQASKQASKNVRVHVYLGEGSSCHLHSALVRCVDLEVMPVGAVETQEARPG